MAHADLNALFDQFVTFAKRFLTEQEGFLPFAACVDSAGKLNLFAADIGPEQQHAPAPAMIQLLKTGLRSRAQSRSIRAAGICFDETWRAGGANGDAVSDAIQCVLEHENGESVTVFLPYEKHPGRPTSYGEPVASKHGAEFFGRPQ